MARVLLDSSGDPLFAIDGAVGQGAPNNRADVLLVQYLLRVASEKHHSDPGTAYTPPGEQPIAIDGTVGPQTIKFISYFQSESRRRGLRVGVVDGRIDPLHVGSTSLVALNNELQERRRSQDLRSDPLFPAELRNSFYTYF